MEQCGANWRYEKELDLACKVLAVLCVVSAFALSAKSTGRRTLAWWRRRRTQTEKKEETKEEKETAEAQGPRASALSRQNSIPPQVLTPFELYSGTKRPRRTRAETRAAEEEEKKEKETKPKEEAKVEPSTKTAL